MRPWKEDEQKPHSLHKMLSRPGSMPPQLARHYVKKYTTTGELIFDPFCGKGTGLLEACLQGRRAIGFDVAPDALITANAKINPPSIGAVAALLDSLTYPSTCADRISWKVRTFFSRKTLSQIVGIRDALFAELTNGNFRRKRTANFVMGTLLGILHGHSKLSLSLPCSHSFAMSPKYVQEYAKEHELRRPYRNVKECLLARAKQLLSDEPPPARGVVLYSSAAKYRWPGRHLANSVDLIVTSPPYLNVQTYAKDSWLRLWLLGYDHRIIRKRLIETGSRTLYLESMKPCLEEMLRVLRPSRHAVIVAGDAPITVDKRRAFFKTAEHLGALATTLVNDGYTFEVEATVVDDIPAHARYYAAVHKDGKKGSGEDGRKGVHVERIVVLKKVAAK